MSEYKTEQEKFWAGNFGEKYVERNTEVELLPANLALFAKILSRTSGVKTLIEFGANIGLNLKAIKQLLPNVDLAAIEINLYATKKLSEIDGVEIYNQSILDYNVKDKKDFVLIKGVLIHINPDKLGSVYKKLYDSSSKYICISEYYNPTPVKLQYRGHSEKLFKRDFAGELMDQYPDLQLLDYGFNYSRDPNFLFGNGTWFLMEKKE